MTPAKILLFGEYTVLVGSQAFAIPYADFSCRISRCDTGFASQNPLSDFVSYLLSHPQQYAFLDLERLRDDHQHGLTIISDIPVQYGVGSSGAVTAEIYRQYVKRQDKPLHQVKAELAAMERFMHGNSSGIDPLVCLYQKPLIFRHEGTIQIINHPIASPCHVFLIDTQVKAPTRDYVLRFLEDYRHNKPFIQKIQQLTALVNECTDAFLSSSPQFTDMIKKLSQLQLNLFPFLFPPKIIDHLRGGMEKDLFYAKLCGSGGGGFALAFTTNLDAAQQYFTSKQIPMREVRLTPKDDSMGWG